MHIRGKAPLQSLPRLLDDDGSEWLCMSGIRIARRLVRVDKRPSSWNNMKLLSLNKGAIHGYVNEDHWARYAVEQGQAAWPEAPVSSPVK